MITKLQSIGGGLYLWKVRVRIGARYFHRHFQLTTQAAAKLHADLLEAKARSDAGLPHALPGLGKTLGAAAAEYQQHQRTLERDAKHITDSARSIQLLRDRLGDACALDQITRADVIAWQQARKQGIAGAQNKGTANPLAASPRTCNKALAELRAFFTWCCESGYIENNPAAHVPKITELVQPPRAPKWSDFCRLADYLWQHRPQVAIVFECLADSGARINEVLRAAPADVDASTRLWRKRVKGSRVVQVDATPWIIHALCHATTDTLCPREDGQPFKYRAILTTFKRACRQLGLDMTPHFLRHGRATWDVESGASVRAVQERLAHTSVMTTQRYFKHATALRNAAAGPRTRAPESLCAICHKTVAGSAPQCPVAAPADLHAKRAKLFQERYLSHKTFGGKKVRACSSAVRAGDS